MKPVGIIGVGAMGGAMAECLLRKGFEVIVRDVVPERVEALVRMGATRADSALDAGMRAAYDGALAQGFGDADDAALVEYYRLLRQ